MGVRACVRERGFACVNCDLSFITPCAMEMVHTYNTVNNGMWEGIKFPVKHSHSLPPDKQHVPENQKQTRPAHRKCYNVLCAPVTHPK